MSRDRGTQRQKNDYGYGAVCGIDGAPFDGFLLTDVNQEHGIVSRAGGGADRDIARHFPVGTRLRILPNHACATGTQFSEYHLVGPHGTVQTWRRFNGW